MNNNDIDRQIAEKVMGWYQTISGTWHPSNYWVQDFTPSTNIAHAWQVVEKLVKEGAAPALINDDNGHWALAMDGMQEIPSDELVDMWTSFLVTKDLWADTAPLAICKAALEAIESETPPELASKKPTG